MRSIWMRSQLLPMALTLGTTLLPASAYADQPAGVPRIGVLMPKEQAWTGEAFRDGLRDLGYVEGKNIVIEWRLSDKVAELDASRQLAAELVHLEVDLIVAAGTPASRAAMDATDKIPVIFAPAGDPVSSGLAASLARPGKNGTGVSVVSTELYPKRLELLHALVPRAKRIAYLSNSSNPAYAHLLAEAQIAARTLSVTLEVFDARNKEEVAAAMRAVQARNPDAVLVGGDLVYMLAPDKVAQTIRNARLPAVFPYKEYHRHGVLMSYGTSQTEVGRRAAGYVDKILKGAKPAELPIEQISKYDLVIDLRVANALAIKVPQDLLLRADEVIR